MSVAVPSITRIQDAHDIVQTGIYNVAFYGATGDGVTDDTAAFQAAMDACADGGWVDVPPGRYLISGTLVPPKYSGNEGAMGTLLMRGAGRAAVDDIYDAHTYGSTLFKSSPVADEPIFSLAATRGVTFERINFVAVREAAPAWSATTVYEPGQRVTADSKVWECCIGGTSGATGPSGAAGSMFTGDGDCSWTGLASGLSPVRGSVGIATNNSVSRTVFRECGFAGWEHAIRIGTYGVASVNDDFWTFDACIWQGCTVAIRNFGTESYMIRSRDCHFEAAVAYYTTGNAAGSVMNDFKAAACFFYTTTAIALYDGGTPHSGRGMIDLDGCLLEGSAHCQLLRVSPANAHNACGFSVRNCVFNTADSEAIYNPAYRWVTYYGKGPFIFENNILIGAGRVPFEVGTWVSGLNTAAVQIVNNVFCSARYAILGPPDDDNRPAIYEQGNICRAEAKIAAANPEIAVSVDVGPEPIIGGVRQNIVRVPLEGETYREGCTYTAEGGLRVSVCRQRGTVLGAAVSGVTATLVSGASVATITAGATAEIRKIRPGSFISIGTAEYLQMNEIVGSTIYLKKAYTGSTKTDGAVAVAGAVFYTVWYRQTAAPTGYASMGDLAWASAPAAAGTAPNEYVLQGWRCTAPGTPGTWVEIRTIKP